MLKLKQDHAAAQAGLENHAAIQALAGVLHRHQMREHDLAAEMIARRGKLEEQALAEAREVTAGQE
ncbi:MAG: hypothetical protein ACREDH_03630 [Methylocella sp.]